MKLPKELTTVTKTSKTLAYIVFLILPFIGFFLGMTYQQTLDLANQQATTEPLLTKRASTPTPYQTSTSREQTSSEDTSNWKTYISLNGKYQFQYPNDVAISEEKQLRTDLFENYTYIKKGDQRLATIIFFASSNTEYPTLDDFAKRERLQRDDLPDQTKDIISISNTTAYKFKLDSYGNPGPVVIIKLNNQYIHFINQGFQNFDQVLQTFKFLDQTNGAEGKACGGFAGEKGEFACPTGYKCQYPKPMYPDAQGKCVKI